MDSAILYDIINMQFLRNFRENIDNEKTDYFNGIMQKCEAEFKDILTPEQLKFISHCIFDMILYDEDKELQTGIQLANYAFKLGIELQKIIDI